MVVTSREPYVVASKFLTDHRGRDVTEIRSANRFWEYRAVQSGRPRFADELPGKNTRLLDFVHVRIDFDFHEPIDCIANCFDVVW